MKVPIKILHLEDDEADAELIKHALKEAGLQCEFTRVETRESFYAALKGGAFDLIISDYSMPGFDGTAALQAARELLPEAPFIFSSGTIGEERAVESLTRGATDYILKNRLNRLPSAVLRSLREVDERKERIRAEQALRESEARFKAFMDHVPAVSFIKDEAGCYLYVNQPWERLFGPHRGSAVGKTDSELWPPETAGQFRANDQTVLSTGQPLECTETTAVSGGPPRSWLVIKFPIPVDGGKTWLGGLAIDVTERVKS